MALLFVRYVLIGWTLVTLLYCDSYALLCGRSRDSSGSVVTLRAGRLGEGMIFFLFHRLQTSSGVHPAKYPVATGPLFPGAKRSVR